jgi:hypothetical protein
MLNYRNTPLHQISSPERVLGTTKVFGLSTITTDEAPSPPESPAAFSSLNLLQLPTNLSLLNLILSFSKPIISLSTAPPRPLSLSPPHPSQFHNPCLVFTPLPWTCLTGASASFRLSCSTASAQAKRVWTSRTPVSCKSTRITGRVDSATVPIGCEDGSIVGGGKELLDPLDVFNRFRLLSL